MVTITYESLEKTEAKNRVHELLDGQFYHGQFFEDTEDGEMPNFIGLADKIIDDLVEAGIHIPENFSR